MIIYHQNNVAAFAGNMTYLWVGQPLFTQLISVTSAGPTFNVVWAAQSTIVINTGVQT